MPQHLLFVGNDIPVPLENIFRKGCCFFIGGGPSLNTQNLSLLQQRGIFTLAVNNIAARHIQPNIWMAADDMKSYHDIILNDPTIWKIVKADRYHAIKTKPNVMYFKWNEAFNVDTFLTEPTVNFGCCNPHSGGGSPYGPNKKIDSLGCKGRRSIMLSAMRIMYYLGFRTIFLLGCDFNMQFAQHSTITPKGNKQPYAFEQHKWKGGVDSNNRGYEILNKRFTALVPFFQKSGFEIFNCTPGSKLTAFPTMDYNKALSIVLKDIPTKVKLAKMYGGRD